MSESKYTIYGSLTALDREDVTRVLWTRTGEWMHASEVEREIERLRQQRDELLEALRAAERDLATFEREMSGIAPEAKSPALPLIRAAIARAEGRSGE